MTSRIPPLLEAYLGLPREAALLLLTGVLGASTNWLLLRHIYSLQLPRNGEPSFSAGGSTGNAEASSPSEAAGGENAVTGVVFVSFLRDAAFWSDGLTRLGVSLDSLGRQGRFVFVDGLSGLFVGSGTAGSKSTSTTNDGHAVQDGASKMWTRTLIGCRLDSIGRTLAAAVDEVAARCSRVALVLDQPDVLLAAAGEEVTVAGLEDMIMDLREVYATVITVSADEPLISAQETGLEREHAAFVLSLAHQAEVVTSLRLLDTGTAKDVSGVIRITAGGSGHDGGRRIEEKELLYYVGGDGGVRVFEKGQ